MLIEIKNDIKEISRICDIVKKFCTECSISDEKYHDIVLILDEMISNIINYAYPDGGNHTFTLNLCKNEKQLVIELSDDGIAFDPLKKDLPDIEASLEERKIGGLGIFIVKQLSEIVEYSRIEDKNQLKIIVSIHNN